MGVQNAQFGYNDLSKVCLSKGTTHLPMDVDSRKPKEIERFPIKFPSPQELCEAQAKGS